MRFEHVGAVLEQIQQFHQEMGEIYHENASQTDSARARMLLEYLGGRHMDLALSLANFRQHKSRDVLGKYIPFSQDIEGMKDHLQRELAAASGIDDITVVALGVTDKFMDAFTTALSKAQDKDVKETFQSLVHGTERERRKLARNANLLLDF